MALPFDYNLLNLLVHEGYMVCAIFFIVKHRNIGEPLFTDLAYKGIHSNKMKSPKRRWLETSKWDFLHWSTTGRPLEGFECNFF